MLSEMNKLNRLSSLYFYLSLLRPVVAGDQLQKRVQDWLSPPDPITNHDLFWRANHTGTTSWFFRSDVLTEWKKEGPFKFLWIRGKCMIFNLSARDSC
jgi:hypothetical protein